MTVDPDSSDRGTDLTGSGPTIGRSFVERLLLSIVDAHPNPNVTKLEHRIRHDQDKRLRSAMAALFNEKLSKELPDKDALYWMATQYIADREKQLGGALRPSGAIRQARATRRQKVRSAQQLARDGSAKFYPRADRSESLRNKWAEQMKFWLDMVRNHDDVREAVETHSLAKIWAALEEARVPVVPNWPDGHPMSEQQMLRTGFRELEKLVELRRKDANRAPGSVQTDHSSTISISRAHAQDHGDS